MADQPISPESATVTDSGLFVRNATGLVRGMSQRASVALNLIPGHPIQTLAAVMFAFLALFPGANPYLALLIVLPMTLSFSYAFGLLTQMIPRSGGDYMIVSRVLGPAARLHLVVLHDDGRPALERLLRHRVRDERARTLVRHGRDDRASPGPDRLRQQDLQLQGHRGWVFFLGSAMIVVACLIHLAGWRWMIRFLSILFWVVTGGLLLAVATFLFTGKSSFAKNFDSFAGPGEYQATIDRAVKAGTQVSPSFSFGQTIILVAGLATVSIYCYWSTFVGGELRQASTLKTANNMARAGLVGLSARRDLRIHHPALGRQPVHDRGERRWPEGRLPVRTVVHVPVGRERRQHALRDRDRDLLLRVLAADHLAVAAAADTHAVRLRVRRDAAQDLRLDDAQRRAVGLGDRLRRRLDRGARLGDRLGSFFKALAYATLIQLIAMGLVGLSALVVAYRKPELYRAPPRSGSSRAFR